ncbi:MAG: hypothetical protein R3F60_32130 [bacterium]
MWENPAAPQTGDQTILALASLALASLALSACDSEEDHHHHDADAGMTPIEVGCAHFTYGDPQPRTAALADPGEGATIAAVHQRYEIALPGSADAPGLIAFQAGLPGDFYFMLGTDVPFELRAEGAVVASMSSVAPGDECAEAAMVHAYALEIGTYELRFGPTAETSVVLVAHMAGQDHDHTH